MKTQMLAQRMIPAAMLLGGLAQADAGIAETSGYQLVVTEDASGARALLKGHYRAAERMSQLDQYSRSTARHFEGLLTECVAQIKQERLRAARRSCESAVRGAMRAGPAASRRGSGIAAAKVASGVLKALNGDKVGSRHDFEIALEYQPNMPAAAHNLAVLEGDAPTRVVALAEITQ